MKILVASDEKTNVTDVVLVYLKEKGHEVSVCGALVSDDKKWHWAEISQEAGEKVAKGEFDMGVFFCWSGTGTSMAANKVKGIRAALCWDEETAELARKWNDANILCMSLRYVSETVAKEIIDGWLSASFDEEGFNQAHKLDQW